MNARATVRVLIGESAHRRFGDLVAGADPSVEMVVMASDGSLHGTDGEHIEREAAAIDVAWASGDLFTDGGPAAAFLDVATSSPSLRWFQTPAAGVDHPMYGRLMSRGVRVSNSHVQSVPIAEFVIRSVLDHFQDAPAWVSAQARREWRRRRWREIWGTSWMIIGFGAIGTDVAVRAAPFGVHIIGVRRHPVGNEPADELISPAEVLGTLPRADVVVLAAPSTPETYHLVSEEFLRAMRQDAFLVNVGRGALIDETSLVAALDRGALSGAALDVAEQEPLPDESPLWSHPRVAITPHNSATGDKTAARAADLFVRNLRSFLAEQPLENELTGADLVGAPEMSPRRSELL